MCYKIKARNDFQIASFGSIVISLQKSFVKQHRDEFLVPADTTDLTCVSVVPALQWDWFRLWTSPADPSELGRGHHRGKRCQNKGAQRGRAARMTLHMCINEKRTFFVIGEFSSKGLSVYQSDIFLFPCTRTPRPPSSCSRSAVHTPPTESSWWEESQNVSLNV